MTDKPKQKKRHLQILLTAFEICAMGRYRYLPTYKPVCVFFAQQLADGRPRDTTSVPQTEIAPRSTHNMAFMECTDEMYAHYGDLVDAKEKEFAEFPKDLKIKMQTSVTREEVARQCAALAR